MIYPAFLKKNDTIGITAPSAGVGRKLESFETSLSVLKKQGYRIKETGNVRINDVRGGSAKERGNELTSLFLDDEVNFVMAAAGGDFLNEILPYVDFNILKKHPKWLMGFSDPTGILYPYTTLYDVSTIYGANAGDYDISPLPKYLKNNLELIKGNLIEQHNYSRWQKALPWDVEGFQPDTKVRWECTEDAFAARGRCIGGCIDGLKDLIGTKYDGTARFIRKYKDDGLIWYFDNFSLSAENLYRTLIQMKYAGWFQNAEAIILGRTLIESSDTGMTYAYAAAHAVEEVPVIYQADIGHTMPHLTMINGAMLSINYEKHKCSLRFSLDR